MLQRGKLIIDQPLSRQGIVVTFQLNEAGEVWQTVNEIAHNLGCYLSAVYSNIRFILKNEELYADEVYKEVSYFDDKGNEHIMVLYNLDMIIALAFRIKSYRATEFRKWIRKTVVTPIRKREILLVDTSKLETRYEA